MLPCPGLGSPPEGAAGFGSLLGCGAGVLRRDGCCIFTSDHGCHLIETLTISNLVRSVTDQRPASDNVRVQVSSSGMPRSTVAFISNLSDNAREDRSATRPGRLEN